MAEVKARERGASGQEEAALALEECVEHLALERVSLLGTEQAMATPAFDQEAPECIAPTQQTPEPLQRARHLQRSHELPNIELACLAQHLAE